MNKKILAKDNKFFYMTRRNDYEKKIVRKNRSLGE